MLRKHIPANISMFLLRAILAALYAGVYLLIVYLLVPKTRRLLRGFLQKRKGV